MINNVNAQNAITPIVLIPLLTRKSENHLSCCVTRGSSLASNCNAISNIAGSIKMNNANTAPIDIVINIIG